MKGFVEATRIKQLEEQINYLRLNQEQSKLQFEMLVKLNNQLMDKVESLQDQNTNKSIELIKIQS